MKIEGVTVERRRWSSGGCGVFCGGGFVGDERWRLFLGFLEGKLEGRLFGVFSVLCSNNFLSRCQSFPVTNEKNVKSIIVSKDRERTDYNFRKV